MAAKNTGPAKGEAAAPPAVSPEGPATPPGQPATPPEQPATPPSDGEKPPAERVELSKDVTGDQPAPDGEVRFAPVERYVLEEKVPVRAGGYVLTDRGWVPDPDAERPAASGVGDPEQAEQAERTVRAEQSRQVKAAERNKKG